MSRTNSTETSPADQVPVWETIHTFESILELFPHDTGALASLAAAYEQAGDTAKTVATLRQLAGLYIDGREWLSARQIAERLLVLQPGDAEAERLWQTAAENTFDEGGDGPLQLSLPSTETSADTSPMVDIEGELELGWLLLENEVITPAEHEAAIATLTEGRLNPMSEDLMSLLADLASMETVSMDRVVDFLCTQTNTPYIDVERVELPDDLPQGLPLRACRRMGVLPFGQVGGEALVAILNPFCLGLRETVASRLGTNVHFYLTAPGQLQTVLGRWGTGATPGQVMTGNPVSGDDPPHKENTL